MRGIFLDVTGRKQAEEANELLAGEMSHRVKNLLLVASQLARITSRSAATTADMAQDLTRRLTALGRAHDLVRPRGGRPVEAALLGDLLTVLLQAYDDTDGSSGRIRVSVPRMDIGEAAATTLALVVHELATNSLKYGALSVGCGTLDLRCTVPRDDVVLVWAERGGPPVVEPSASAGYGSETHPAQHGAPARGQHRLQLVDGGADRHVADAAKPPGGLNGQRARHEVRLLAGRNAAMHRNRVTWNSQRGCPP